MKQRIEIIDTPDFVRKFILAWKQKKGYSQDFSLTLGEVIELTIATTYTFYKDDSDGRFFNNVLTNNESLISWDGMELIDILFYEVVQLIKKRISHAGTFNSVVDNEEKVL